MKNKPKDPLHERIVIGVAASGAAAVERARVTDTSLILWRNNRVETVSPDEISKPSAKPGDGKRRH